MFGSRAGRAWRGLAAAAVATLFAVVSHSIADGTAAPLLAIVVAFAVAAPVCVALAGRRLSWLRLSAAVGISQFGFHALMVIGFGASSAGVAASVPSHAHGAVVADTLAAPVAASAAASAGHHWSAWMWVAHACAAIATILVLGRGEQALRALLDLLTQRIVALVLTWDPSPIGVRLAAPRTELPHALAAFFLSDARRRGPPLPA